MNTVTATPRIGELARWTSLVGFALLLVGFVAVSTVADAGAAQTSNAELEELICTGSGGQWIEVFYPSGALKSMACLYPDGSFLECNTMADKCGYVREDPAPPSKTLPDTGGQVGGDLDLSAEPAPNGDPIQGAPAQATDKK